MKYFISAIILSLAIFKLEGSENTKELLPNATVNNNQFEKTRIIPYFQLFVIFPGAGISLRSPVYHNFCYQLDINSGLLPRSAIGETSISGIYYPFRDKGFNLGAGVSGLYYHLYLRILGGEAELCRGFRAAIPLFIGYEGTHFFTSIEGHFLIDGSLHNIKIGGPMPTRLKFGYSF